MRPALYRQAVTWLGERKRAYQEVFVQHPRGKTVLKDLARFCGAQTTAVTQNPRTGAIDEKATYIRLGRQEVWLHIQRYLHLTEEELFELKATPQARAMQTANNDNDNEDDF